MKVDLSKDDDEKPIKNEKPFQIDFDMPKYVFISIIVLYVAFNEDFLPVAICHVLLYGYTEILFRSSGGSIVVTKFL